MGRPAGSGNKNKKFLLNRLQDQWGEDFHPIMKIAANCNELQSLADEAKKDYELVLASFPDNPGEDDFKDLRSAKSRFTKALGEANHHWGRMAEYTEPKLKSIEHNLGDDLTDDLCELMDVIADASG